MFMRKSIFEKVGYFDERFCVDYETENFSKRLAQKEASPFSMQILRYIAEKEQRTQ